MSILTLGMNDISENMQATKDKLSSKDAQIAAQQGQLLKKAAELEEMKQSLNDALQKLNNETSRVLQLEASLVRVNADLQSSNLTSQNTSTALAFAEEKFRLKDLEARDLENALVSLSHDSDGHQSRLAKMETEKRKLEARVKELESASRIHNAPTTPWTPARARSSSLSDVRIHALESDLTELRTTLSSRDTELHAIQTKLDAVQRDALRANNEYMASEARLRNRIKELDELVVEKEDELQYLKQQGGTGGLEREEELLKRIDEDDAKIEALEMIIGEARDLPALKERLRKSEERLGSEALRIGQLEDRNIELVQEKEQALDEVEVAKAKIGELEAQNRLFSAEVQNLQNQPPSGTDRETVENMERLLNAVERLRGERDGLRRDLEFLNMESKFTITALETRITTLSSSSAPPSVTIPSIFITDTTADAITSEKEQKEHRRLRGIVLGSAIVIGHLERDRTDMEARCNSAYSAHEEMAHRYSLLETRLHEAEARLTTSMQLLEETTVHRNDALARLSSLDTEWRTKFDDANAAQQESRNTVDHLNAQLVEISKIVEAVTSERDSLHVQVANLNSDIASARQELTDAESRYTQLQFHQLSDMPSTQATKTLRSQIEELEGRVMRRTEQVGIHQHDIRRLETNLRLQEERLTEMTTEMEMILAQKDAMVEDCADAREQRDEAILNVERLEEEVERLESLLEDRGREQEAIIEVMFLNSARTKEKMNVDAGQIDAMRARMQSLLDDRDNTLHSVQSLNEALEEAKQRLQSSEDGARRMSESLALSQQELTHSIMSTQDLDRVKIDLSKKVSDLEHQLESRIAEATALASKLNSLEKESTAAISRGTATITDLESQVEESRSLLASKEGEHRRMVEELQRQLAQKDQLVVHNDLEGELVQLKMKHVEELGQLQSRLVEANTAFDELQARHDSVQLELKQSLADSAESKDEVEQQLKNATEELNGLKEMKENLEAIGREQVEQVQRLEERVAVLDSELSVARSEQEEIDSSLRHAVDDLAETRLRFEGLLSEARDELFETRTLLDEESTAVNQLREQVSALQQKVNDEVQERAQDQSSHEQELQSISRLHQQAESRVEELVQQISTLEANIEKTDAAVQNLHGEKKATERDMTALEANFQRSLSMTRHLESQIHESEHTIDNLRAELEQVNNHLAKVEKACNAAEVSLSLQNAQHKREVSQLQRELESFKGRPSMEQVVSELEERNNEMEDLLKRKCEEIEENDDVKLGLMKENKSLKNKMESLTRKVNNLQAKLTAAKATLPSPVVVEQRIPSSSSVASSIPSSASASSLSSSPPTSISTHASGSRPRSNTMVGTPRVALHSSNTSPPVIPDRLNRVVSVPSTLPRPKTPERRTVLGPVFRAMSPKKEKPQPEPSPAAQSKKRPAPDDFEGYEVPPQAFTADSLPGDEAENTTPKVRRVLSSIQSGFTPTRHQARPMAPMPSPKRANPVFMKSPAATSMPDFLNNVFPSAPTVGPPVDGKKRSWLGKIRGASSATTQRDFA